jgi:hypothetical protein
MRNKFKIKKNKKLYKTPSQSELALQMCDHDHEAELSL